MSGIQVTLPEIQASSQGRPREQHDVYPRQFKETRTAISDWVISFYLTSSILAMFLLFSIPMAHWFVIPVYLCGVLIGTDLVRVARGNIDPFTAEALVGLVGYHMFFLAPLLNVFWDEWMPYIIAPDDWRPWLGRMATLNLLGLMAYLSIKSRIQRRKLGSSPKRRLLQLNYRAFSRSLVVLLTVSGVLQVAIYATFGGVGGYIQAFETQSDRFKGLGGIFIVSEAFPMLAMLGYVVWASRRQSKPSWPTIMAVLALFLIMRLLFGGFRGSRGTIVWAMFWAIGMIHVWLKPISRTAMLTAAAVGVMFMYVFAFYKDAGSDFISGIQSQGGFETLQQNSARSVRTLILGDFSRADVQAFLLYQLNGKGSDLDYHYAHGETYLAAVTLLAPSSLLSPQFIDKVEAGTYVLQSGSTSILGDALESRVYGISGEAILNFGWWAAPLAYVALGVVVGAAGRWERSLRSSDCRKLLAPLVMLLAFYPLVWDLDNVVVIAAQFGLLPVILVYSHSRYPPASIPPHAWD